jgi:UDP-N-acetylmuramyl pentapeptide phosphotransferase/UDP-N-acetylglucosamine-1-phosphate transferase
MIARAEIAWLMLTPLLAAVICALLCAALLPWLRRHTLAHPTARSSHSVPTPQGGGIAVMAAVVAVAALAAGAHPSAPIGFIANTALAAALLLALAGAADDRRSLPVAMRLLVQAIAVGAVVWTLPATEALLPSRPEWLARGLLLIAGLWFVNLVNFMDGIDGMTIVEAVPVTATLALFGACGVIDPGVAVIAAALGGAMLGFAPFNRPVARLFLGDVGSLPIGLLMGWGLLDLALRGHTAAALLLPLYYLADATLTLMHRVAHGNVPWHAHREHFYQRATDNGWSVPQIDVMVFFVNVMLAGLAALTVWHPDTSTTGAALAAGGVAVAVLLRLFSRPRRRALRPPP